MHKINGDVDMNDIFNSWIVHKYIAHKGFHTSTEPENSLGAFQNAINKDYAIELDVQMISDGNIVVFHDELLGKLTGKDGYISNLKKTDLKNYHILGSEYTIPLLTDVLKCVNGQTPILIEIKNSGKVGPLEEKLLEILKKYKGEYAIQCFNPYVLEWFLANAPEISRGQLSSNFKGEKLAFLKKFVLRRLGFVKKTKANFISYEAQSLPNRFVKKYSNLPLLAWTVRSQSEYIKVAKYCDNIIFENFEPTI